MSLSLPRIYLADIPKTLNGQKTDKNMSTLQSIYSTLTIRTTHELAPEKKTWNAVTLSIFFQRILITWNASNIILRYFYAFLSVHSVNYVKIH